MANDTQTNGTLPGTTTPPPPPQKSDTEKTIEAMQASISRVPSDPSIPTKMKLREIKVREGFNPRKTVDPEREAIFNADVAARGVLQPIIVGRETSRSPIFVVAGHKRYAAALKAGLEEIPTIGYTASIAELSEIALIENLVREDMTTFDVACAMAEFRIRNPKISQDAIAGKFSGLNGRTYSRSSVSTFLMLTEKLSPEVKKLWSEDRLSWNDLTKLAQYTTEEQNAAVAGPTTKGRGGKGGRNKGEAKSRKHDVLAAALKAVKAAAGKTGMHEVEIRGAVNALKFAMGSTEKMLIGSTVLFPITEEKPAKAKKAKAAKKDA